MANSTPLETAHAYFSPWNAYDVDAIVALFGDCGTFWDNQMPSPRPMRDLAPGFHSLLASTNNLVFEVVESFAAEDGRVVVEWIMRGEKADGTPSAIPGIDVFGIKSEAIKAVRAYMNPSALS
ncbi:MAG: nuclear transport factor 2 family protein [Pseudomonadota bacterium]